MEDLFLASFVVIRRTFDEGYYTEAVSVSIPGEHVLMGTINDLKCAWIVNGTLI